MKKLGFLCFLASILTLTSRADVLTGLVGYWPFDDGSGSSTAADDSGFADRGTLTNFADTTYTTMWTNGYIGSAVLFNANGATSNYISIPDSPVLHTLDTNRAFSLAAWVYLSVDGGAQSNGAPILCKGVTGQESYSLDLVTNGAGGANFRVLERNSSGNSSEFITSITTPVAGQWYHVVGEWHRSATYMAMYVNGNLEVQSNPGNLTTLFSNTHPVSVGCKQATASSGYNIPFQGVIDEVHIYNRALSASDVAELYSLTNLTTLATNYAPIISTPPRSVSCFEGDSPVFAVAVTNSPLLLSYQWQLGGTNLAGATSSLLVVSNAQASNAGSYAVIVTNFEGSVTSSAALLTVQALPPPNTASGLAGYWKFDDGSGSSTAADSSGSGNTGLLVGFTDTTYTSMWQPGLINGALAFNGDGSGQNVVAVTNVGVAAPPAVDFSGNPVFTLACWVQCALGQTNDAGVVANGLSGGGEQYVVDINGGYYRFYVRDTNGTVYTAQTAVAPSGGWQHLAAVLDADNGIMNCYVNGVLAASAVAPFSLQYTSREMSIGNRLTSSAVYGLAFTGLVDDLRVYNRALTSADVAALYSATRVPIILVGLSDLALVEGVNAQLAPTVTGGQPPFTYQWRRGGTNIAGATLSALPFADAVPAMAGLYDVIVSDSGYVPAVTSSVVQVSITSELTFNGAGLSWSAQGNSFDWLGTNVLELTADLGNEVNSAFYDYPLYIAGFQASFTYQDVSIGGADGAAFVLQNDRRGAVALGTGGGSFGYGGVTNSAALEFDIYANNGVGFAVRTNGATGKPYASASPVNLAGGDPINVSLQYANGSLSLTLTDAVAQTFFTTNININILAAVGASTAYVGFTAGDGSVRSTQQVSDFSFVSWPVLTIQPLGNSVVLSWPEPVGAYVLQQSPTLAPANWSNVSNPVVPAKGQNQVTLTVGAGAQYFRLAHQ